ncbi:hypothetical protein VSU19_20595 [Verrucomicrobiales bacterium BCK34]|nr:hypothetical protein [Verrucomicrobiales bacterium BCK34]
MKSIPAHFDGQQVRLDEDVEIQPQARLLVTILEDTDPERDDFITLAGTTLADSYGDDEVEYTEADLK